MTSIESTKVTNKNKAIGIRKRPNKSGAESGQIFALMTGFLEAEKKLVKMSSYAVDTTKKILKGEHSGATASDALIAATLSAMSGPILKVKPKSEAADIELILPKPIWDFQEKLANKNGCSLCEIQEEILSLYLSQKKAKKSRMKKEDA